MINSYLNKLNDSLFKSIRRTAAGNEITPETSKEIFEIFANAYGVTDRVDVEISKDPTPLKDIEEFINTNCKNCKIFLGTSNKNGDEARFNNFKLALLDETNIIIPSNVNVAIMISATDLRNNINNLSRSYFPDGISDEDFNKIKMLLGV